MLGRLMPFCVLLLAGCIPEEEPYRLVETNPFRGPPAKFGQGDKPAEPPHAQATEAAALKVTRLGRKLLEANRHIGMHPTFTTVGTTHPEVFHRNVREVWVTEGLVKACKTDAQLAAVLALELGKMVSEREARAGPATRAPEVEPPPEVRVGNDSSGRFGPPDGTHLAELARHDKKKRSRQKPLPPPDPQELAGQYLRNAGYERAELEAVRGLLRDAHKNFVLEKQVLRMPVSPGPESTAP